jgi:hypothetical protein
LRKRHDDAPWWGMWRTRRPRGVEDQSEFASFVVALRVALILSTVNTLLTIPSFKA